MTLPIQRLLTKLHAFEPDLEAVLLAGSHARGDADAFSDVDLVAVTRGVPGQAERVWFERLDDGRLLHISVGGEQLTSPDRPEPASWALGFPAVDVQTYLWATDHARHVLGTDPSLRHPAGSPEPEDFVEFYKKLSRSAAADDTIGLRWAARMLGDYSPALLRQFNPERVVKSPIEAMRCALDFPNAPPGYAIDLAVCWGLTPSSDVAVMETARRLTFDLVAFLRERYLADPRVLNEAQRLVLDGTWLEYLSATPGR